MNNPYVLPSEAETNIWTSCIWLTGLYIARALNPLVPGTKGEMLAIAAAGGHPDGASGNFTKLASAMKARYGLTGAVFEGATVARAAVLAAARAGPVAVGLAGDGYNLGPRYQDRHFGHAIAVLYQSGTTGLQFDPLAAAGYAGDPFTEAELFKFATAAIIFKEEIDMTPVILRPVRQEWTTGAGDPGGVFYTGGPALGTKKQFNTATRVTTIAETTTINSSGAKLSGPWRVILYGSELLWMERANLTPIDGTRVPATGFGLTFGGDPAALAAAQAQVTDLNGKLAAAQAAAAAALAAEAAATQQAAAAGSQVAEIKKAAAAEVEAEAALATAERVLDATIAK